MDKSDFLPRNQPKLDESCTVGRFAGRRAIVTGGCGGIGRAVAERFLNDGAAVAIFDIDGDAAAAAVRDLQQHGYACVTSFAVDVTREEAAAEACAKFAEWKPPGYSERILPGICSLVNCACTFVCAAESGDSELWAKSLAVNVTGYFNMTKACLPYLRAAPEGSRAVVNISSISGHRAQRLRWNYSAAKGAVHAMTRNMALDLGISGIRLNTVSPGYIWSPEQQKASPDGTRAGMASDMRRYSMIGRDGNTTEVAAAVTFLCSRDASFITGADLLVDGGYTTMGVDADAKFASCTQK